jgi:hypothetical protein
LDGFSDERLGNSTVGPCTNAMSVSGKNENGVITMSFNKIELLMWELENLN